MNRHISSVTVGTLCLLCLLATPVLAAPPIAPWTAVGSSGTVDEQSTNLVAFNGPWVGFLSGIDKSVSIDIRYNVTNTFDNSSDPAVPPWTRFELGSQAPVGSVVMAVLMEVNPCTGVERVICKLRANPISPCATCTFAPYQMNFAKRLYYVHVRLTRNTASPRVSTLRIF